MISSFEIGEVELSPPKSEEYFVHSYPPPPHPDQGNRGSVGILGRALQSVPPKS